MEIDPGAPNFRNRKRGKGGESLKNEGSRACGNPKG
jgi:hypothetical protein